TFAVTVAEPTFIPVTRPSVTVATDSSELLHTIDSVEPTSVASSATVSCGSIVTLFLSSVSVMSGVTTPGPIAGVESPQPTATAADVNVTHRAASNTANFLFMLILSSYRVRIRNNLHIPTSVDCVL